MLVITALEASGGGGLQPHRPLTQACLGTRLKDRHQRASSECVALSPIEDGWWKVKLGSGITLNFLPNASDAAPEM